MSNPQEIDGKLRQLLRAGYAARPFVCSGSPFDCSIALIGANPGTTTSFWDSWNTETGFDKEAWLAAFNRDPANRRKKSRHHIDQLVAALLPHKVIELNAYPYYAPRTENLTPDLQDTTVLEYLLAQVRPRILLASGKHAIRALQRLAGEPVKADGKFHTLHIAGYEARVLADEHFLRWEQGDLFAKIAEVARLIKAEAENDT